MAYDIFKKKEVYNTKVAMQSLDVGDFFTIGDNLYLITKETSKAMQIFSFTHGSEHTVTGDEFVVPRDVDLIVRSNS